MESNGSTVLTLEEAAERLRISPEDVRKRIRLVTVTTGNGRKHSAEPEPRPDTPPQHYERLIARLESEVDYLRRQLDLRNDDLRRSDEIVLMLTQRLVELAAPKETALVQAASPERKRRRWWLFSV